MNVFKKEFNSDTLNAEGNKLKAERKEEWEIKKEIDSLCFSIFGSDLGKTLLDKLFEYFIHCRVIANPHQHANVAFYQEGQNSLIRLLKQCYLDGKAEAENEIKHKEKEFKQK